MGLMVISGDGVECAVWYRQCRGGGAVEMLPVGRLLLPGGLAGRRRCGRSPIDRVSAEH